jgi:hypothetical protein
VIINIIHQGIAEKIKFDGKWFNVSKRENKYFEKTVDPVNGNEVTINRYPTKVSATWVSEWAKRRKISLNSSQSETLNSKLEEDKKIIELIECIIEPRSKDFFYNILSKAEGKTLSDVMEVLKILNDNKLSIVMKNTSLFYIFSEDLTQKIEIQTTSKCRNNVPGLFFDEPRKRVCISREFIRQTNKAVKKLSMLD